MLDALTNRRYIEHLEQEVAYLRGRVSLLEIQVDVARKPVTPPVPAKREFPKFTPARTSWDSYLAEQIALQDKEESDGTQSK